MSVLAAQVCRKELFIRLEGALDCFSITAERVET
jgi:hypothetical protein